MPAGGHTLAAEDWPAEELGRGLLCPQESRCSIERSQRSVGSTGPWAYRGEKRRRYSRRQAQTGVRPARWPQMSQVTSGPQALHEASAPMNGRAQSYRRPSRQPSSQTSGLVCFPRSNKHLECLHLKPWSLAIVDATCRSTPFSPGLQTASGTGRQEPPADSPPDAPMGGGPKALRFRKLYEQNSQPWAGPAHHLADLPSVFLAFFRSGLAPECK